NAAGKRELPEKPAHPVGVAGDGGVDLAVCALEVGVGHDSRSAVAGPHDVYRVKVPRLYHPVQVHVHEVQAWRRPRVAEQAGLDVLRTERLTEQWVVEQVDLADREVVGRAPVSVHAAQVVRGQWLSGRAGRAAGCSGTPHSKQFAGSARTPPG